MNRKQRREAAKQTKPKPSPAWHKLTKDEITARLIQNGITAADLKKEFDRGYDAGLQDGGRPTTEIVFAATCLALHENFRFGKKRCLRTLNSIYSIMSEYVTSTEAADAVFEKIGLTLGFDDDPFEPVQEV